MEPGDERHRVRSSRNPVTITVERTDGGVEANARAWLRRGTRWKSKIDSDARPHQPRSDEQPEVHEEIARPPDIH